MDKKEKKREILQRSERVESSLITIPYNDPDMS